MSLTQSKEVNSLSRRYSTYIERRITRTVMVGNIAIGSDYPVRVQSMINEDTMDVDNSYLAIKRLHEVGCEIVRLTVPSLAHAKAVGDIKEKFHPVFKKIDHQPLFELDLLEDGDCISVAKCIKNKTIKLLPQLSRVEVYEKEGCGVILDWKNNDLYLPE